MANNYTAQVLNGREWVDVLTAERFYKAIDVRRALNTAYPDRSARVLRDGSPMEARKHPGGWADWAWFSDGGTVSPFTREYLELVLRQLDATNDPNREITMTHRELVGYVTPALAYLSLLEAVAPLLAAAEKATPGPWRTEDSIQWNDFDEYGGRVYCPWDRDLIEGATVADAPCEDTDECEGHDVTFPRLGYLTGPTHYHPAGEENGYYVAYDDTAFIATARNTAAALRDLLGPTGGEA